LHEAQESRIDAARALFLQNPLNRPVLYSILKACSNESWYLDELEAHIAGLDEFEKATQPPYFLIEWLVEAQVLDSWEVDVEGVEITPVSKEGLTEDEIDDLVAATVYRTNAAGEAILDEFSPKSRLAESLDLHPARIDTYIEVLEFCAEERSLRELDGLLRGRDVLMDGREAGERPMQPSVFVDKLAAIGAIIFKEGWVITEEGKELLESIKDR